jgi:hypothetical protein
MTRATTLHRVRKPVAILLLATLNLTWAPPILAHSNSGLAPAYSGETLFRGLFFVDGPAAEKIPELQRAKVAYGLNNLNEKQRMAVRNLEDSLISRFKQADPGFFKRFQGEIQSGDHRRVQAMLQEASRMIITIIYQNNKGLESLLDPKYNQRFRERMSQSGKLRQLTTRVDNPRATVQTLRGLNRDIIIDRDIYINRFTDRFVQSVRYIDRSINRDLNRSIDQDFALDRNLDVFHFLDVDRNLFKNFDRVNINRSADNEYNPVGDVTVEIETAVYAVVAVAVFVAAVAVVVVGLQSRFANDRAGLWNEQLVNSIATRLNVAAR